ncbi:MAG: dihydrolipoamide acetyltransferase family protein, partial [Phycisphaerae bacterium]
SVKPENKGAKAVGQHEATPILMPQAGNSMEEGTIIKWRVQVGDRITVGQVICEIETDKATIEMEATDAGRVAKIVAEAGAVIPVKQPIAYLSDGEVGAEVGGGAAVAGSKSEAAPQATERKPEPAAIASVVTPAVADATGRVKASPAAKKLAATKGIDLATVGAGSGPEGRILSTDLANVTAAKVAPGGSPGLSSRSSGIVRRPLSKMRKAIATNLQVSKQTVPHFYVKLTINADPLFAFYRAQKPVANCTLNDVVLLAVGKCVGEFAAFRSRIEGNEIVELPGANIGVAVSVADGLVVPVVAAVDFLTLAQLATESKRIVEAARNGKIENMGKGVFSISNMGMLGVEDFTAIINPPESGILAISAVREAVIVKDGAMRPGKVMSMTLSVDHRVVDGALAAQFMARLKVLLEAPEQI